MQVPIASAAAPQPAALRSAQVGARSNGGWMSWMMGVVVIQVMLLIFVATALTMLMVGWNKEHPASSPLLLEDMQSEFHGPAAETARLGRGAGAAAAAGAAGAQLRPGLRGAGSMRVEPSLLYQEQVQTWPYTCWTPKAGLAEPRLTMVTVIEGLPMAYRDAIWMNRMQYAAKQRYRYCELQMTDKLKIPAFTKLPWVLALAPCTDFLIHLDADAQLVNMSLPLSPWVQFMQAKNIDQMFAADIIRQSPINYGVFMIRSAPWIWDFYRKIYNLCTCDWSRMHDWPAEQGIVYDLLAQHLESFETSRSLIVSSANWNHILDQPHKAQEPNDVVVHVTLPTQFPDSSNCSSDQEFTRRCKYIGLEYWLTQKIGSSQYTEPGNTSYILSLFTEEKNGCQQVRQNTLFNAGTTYSNQGDALQASVMDFDVDPATGAVLGVKVSEVACLGYREKKCSLPYLWNTETGQGPWERNHQDISR